MSAVTAEDVTAVLTEARAKKAALLAAVVTLKAAFEARPTLANFRRYHTKDAEMLRQSTRLILLERWAEGLALEGVAA